MLMPIEDVIIGTKIDNAESNSHTFLYTSIFIVKQINIW
jgi:hypothetical protein